jgi:hypothetical protein
MAEQPRPAQVPDPLTLWRDWAQQIEDQWNRYLNQAMGSEAFAAGLGRMLETVLAFQGHLAQQFEGTLKAWNLPTRSDLTDLGARLTAIEERLDRIEALLARPRFRPGAESRPKADAEARPRPRRARPDGE